MNKILGTLLITAIITLAFGSQIVLAQDQQLGTLLPATSLSKDDCNVELDALYGEEDLIKAFASQDRAYKDKKLGCAIKTGRIAFWMIPMFIVYIIEFIIGLSGFIAILFIVIGGYQYIIAGATEGKDKAKNTIKHAIMGLVLILVAWIVVNIVQYIVTI